MKGASGKGFVLGSKTIALATETTTATAATATKPGMRDLFIVFSVDYRLATTANTA